MKIQETISQRALLCSVRQLINGYPDPENPQPPGPWDPVIRRALQRTLWVFGPLPDPWVQVSLNPQPLPPIFALAHAIAQEVIDRAASIQEVTDAQREGNQRGIIIVGGYISRFVDDYCGNDFRLKWPFPGPRPWWFSEEVRGLDLVIASMEFEQAASNTFNEGLKQSLGDASTKLAQTGLSRLQ
jgi:hypothetical protein